MIPQDGQDRGAGAKRKQAQVGASRLPLHLIFQAGIAAVVALGLEGLLQLPAANGALAGVALALLCWLIRELYQPSATRAGARVVLVLRMLSIVGFTFAISGLSRLLT
ncbi:hypothetical protein [Glutamicibacter sp. X7]